MQKVKFNKTLSYSGTLYRKDDVAQLHESDVASLGQHVTVLGESKSVSPKSTTKVVAKPPKATVMTPQNKPVKAPAKPKQGSTGKKNSNKKEAPAKPKQGSTGKKNSNKKEAPAKPKQGK
jgi:hypothetical protein